MTSDEKTKSDKHEKNEEFESNFHSVNDANNSSNESMRTNIHRQREDEIPSYPQHVSKSKEENKNNSENNLQVNSILRDIIIFYMLHPSMFT